MLSVVAVVVVVAAAAVLDRLISRQREQRERERPFSFSLGLVQLFFRRAGRRIIGCGGRIFWKKTDSLSEVN